MRRAAKAGGIGKAAETGDGRELAGIVGQRLGLLVGDHLQAVLDGAQEAIGVGQLLARRRR